MRRLLLTAATSLLASVVPAPPAWAEWVWPLQGEVITPYRNGTDPYASGQHRGIDIAGEVGSTVVAAAGGEVRFAGTAGSSGLTVSIRTADGRFDTSYLHLESAAVREGNQVAAGDRIGTVGTSGARSAAAPHLHFGIRDAGSRHAYHDPLTFLPPPAAAPQGPRETPAPQPAPLPARPAPAPLEAPAGRRVPVGAPNPRRVPVGEPLGRGVPVRAPHARRVPVRAPHARRVPVGAPHAHRVPVRAPQARRVPIGTPNGRRIPVEAPKAGPRPGPQPARTPAHLNAHHRPPAQRVRGAEPTGLRPPVPETRTSSSRGPDLGLVLACLGLVAAAAVLGFSEDGRSATRATRARLSRVLEPLLGRR